MMIMIIIWQLHYKPVWNVGWAISLPSFKDIKIEDLIEMYDPQFWTLRSI